MHTHKSFHSPMGTCSVVRSAGLEVRVAFGGVWKQSLTELSGGQRSLLALSLILAMLLFKPAPIYILDEVGSCVAPEHAVAQHSFTRFV